MSGNSLIPTQAVHDRHYAHTCIVCGAPFTPRLRRPYGQILHCGHWGDACRRCHTFLAELEPPDLPPHRPATTLTRQDHTLHHLFTTTPLT